MKYIIWVLAAAVCALPAAAQKQDNKEVIKTHSSQGFPSDVAYRYPKFSQGQVYFKDGTRSTAHLNFNLFLNEMQFLDGKGDTLSLANEQDVNFIAVGTDTFYVKKGVFETAGDYAYLKLATKQVLRMVDNEKIGAYGIPTSSASISSMSVIDQHNKAYGLAANENYVYVKEKSYYLVLKANSQVLPATKQNVLKSYSRNRDRIEDYIAVNEINFKSEADLRKLLDFCTAEVSKKKK